MIESIRGRIEVSASLARLCARASRTCDKEGLVVVKVGSINIDEYNG
jgi:hypothetical protein